MKIKQKIILSFLLLSVFVSLVGIIGLYANNSVIDSFKKGDKHFESIMSASNEVSSFAKRAEGHTFLYLTLNNMSDRKKAFQRIASLREQMMIIEGNITNPEAIALLKKTKVKTDEMQSILEELFKSYDAEMEQNGRFVFTSHEALLRRLDDVSANIRRDGLEFGKIELKLQEEHNRRAEEHASFLYKVIFIISGFAVSSVIIFGIVFDRNISKPLNRLKDAAIQIGRGGLGMKIDIRSDDEIGELSVEFNKMSQDLRKTSDEITSSREYISNIVSSMDDCLIVISNDGIVKDMNRAACALLGYEKEELTGQSLGRVMMDGEKTFQDIPVDPEHEKNILRAELQLISKSHKKIDVLFSASAMHDTKGNIQGIVCVAQDITERKCAEDKLKKSENRFRMSVENMLDAFGLYSAIRDQGGHIVDFRIDFVNEAACSANRLTRDEQIGKHLCELMPSHRDTGLFNEYCHLVETGEPLRKESMYYEDVYAGKSIKRAFDIRAVKMGDGFAASWRDITQSVQAQEAVRKSLQEKEVLLREIHHRVKNNMQIISSLLSHQMGQFRDNNIKQKFMETQNRIMSMSLIHEKLYQSRDLRNIDIRGYINDLGINLFESYDIRSGKIRLNMDVEGRSMDIDLAISTGLIINELITNSLKYAFPDGREGEIRISLRSSGENMLELTVSDNGIGIPQELDIRKTRSLGLHLVTGLAENQLHGTIDLDRSSGTMFRIKFKGVKS